MSPNIVPPLIENHLVYSLFEKTKNTKSKYQGAVSLS